MDYNKEILNLTVKSTAIVCSVPQGQHFGQFNTKSMMFAIVILQHIMKKNTQYS